MVERKTWKEFKDSKLLWFVNRTLHVFGWAIILNIDSKGEVTRAYPARVKFRGFDEKSETEGFIGLTEHLSSTVEELQKETRL